MNKLIFPLKQNDLSKLKSIKSGESYYLSGSVFVMRDRAHKLYIENDKNIIDFNNTAILYAGPTDNGVIGPTTSARMDLYTEYFANKGVKLFIGKGNRNNNLLEDLKLKYNSRYAITFGGLASYLTNFVVKSELILYPELGCEAIYKLNIKNFPIIFY